MERARDGRSIAVSTKEMRDIAREAHRRGLNRQMTPAHFKLLDPRGIHVLSPQFMHDKADGKKVEPHLRCNGYLKLLGKQQAIERVLDVPMMFVRGHVDEAEAIEKGIAMKAMQEGEDTDGIHIPHNEEEVVKNMNRIVDGSSAVPADVRARAEGKA